MSDVKVGDNVPNLPPELPGDMTIRESEIDELLGVTPKKKVKERDTMEKSARGLDKKSVRIDSENPEIFSVDETKLDGVNFSKGAAEIKKNLWFVRSFLISFNRVMSELLSKQQEMQLLEATMELQARKSILELAKTAAEAAKQLMHNQAQEHMIQAIAAFGNAAVSATQYLQTVRNTGETTKRIRNDFKIDQKETDYKTKLDAYNDFTSKNKSNLLSEDPNAPPNPNLNKGLQKQKEDLKTDLDAAKKHLEEQRYQADSKIQEELRRTDFRVQYMGDIQKQILNGVSSFLTSLTKLDSENQEYLQKMCEGYIAALNKYNDNLAKSREDIRANFDKTVEELKKIAESAMKSHALSGRF